MIIINNSDMDSLNSFDVDDDIYYLVNDLRDICPRLFVGCQKSMPKLVEKHKLSEGDHYWISQVNGEYEVKDRKTNNKTDKMIISRSWLHGSGLCDFDDKLSECTSSDPKYEELPGLLILKDNEQIYDNDGNYYEIEVRGKRDVKSIYFKCCDVAKMLGKEPKYLKTAILNKDRGYERDEDYKVFISIGSSLMTHENNIGPNKKLLFLTYHGLLKVLFTSKNTNIKKFLHWVDNIVYVAHLGTKDQKQAQAAKLLKLDRHAVKAMLSRNPKSMSCIYLLSLGKVKDLRSKFDIGGNYDDNHIIYKFGRTTDLAKIITRHNLNDEYTHARYVNGKLVPGLQVSRKVDKLYLTKEWPIT